MVLSKEYDAACTIAPPPSAAAREKNLNQKSRHSNSPDPTSSGATGLPQSPQLQQLKRARARNVPANNDDDGAQQMRTSHAARLPPRAGSAPATTSEFQTNAEASTQRETLQQALHDASDTTSSASTQCKRSMKLWPPPQASERARASIEFGRRMRERTSEARTQRALQERYERAGLPPPVETEPEHAEARISEHSRPHLANRSALSGNHVSSSNTAQTSARVPDRRQSMSRKKKGMQQQQQQVASASGKSSAQAMQAYIPAPLEPRRRPPPPRPADTAPKALDPPRMRFR